jgi:hypothetical protein
MLGLWLESLITLNLCPKGTAMAATVRKSFPLALLLYNTSLRLKPQVDASDRLKPDHVLSLSLEGDQREIIWCSHLLLVGGRHG